MTLTHLIRWSVKSRTRGADAVLTVPHIANGPETIALVVRLKLHLLHGWMGREQCPVACRGTHSIELTGGDAISAIVSCEGEFAGVTFGIGRLTVARLATGRYGSRFRIC